MFCAYNCKRLSHSHQQLCQRKSLPSSTAHSTPNDSYTRKPSHSRQVPSARRRRPSASHQPQRGSPLRCTRSIVNRAGGRIGEGVDRDRLTSYNDLTKSFYLSRRIFPPPNHKLCRAQATTLRLLQTPTRHFPDITRFTATYTLRTFVRYARHT